MEVFCVIDKCLNPITKLGLNINIKENEAINSGETYVCNSSLAQSQDIQSLNIDIVDKVREASIYEINNKISLEIFNKVKSYCDANICDINDFDLLDKKNNGKFIIVSLGSAFQIKAHTDFKQEETDIFGNYQIIYKIGEVNNLLVLVNTYMDMNDPTIYYGDIKEMSKIHIHCNPHKFMDTNDISGKELRKISVSYNYEIKKDKTIDRSLFKKYAKTEN